MATTERMGVDPLDVMKRAARRYAVGSRAGQEMRDAIAAVAELAAKANKVAVWLGRSALIADTNAQDTRFPSLAEAFSADAKNYRAIEAELRAALAPFQTGGAE